MVVGVENGKLTAQGANNEPSAPDFGTRPYPNAVHDHWQVIPSSPDFAYAFSPEFDIPTPPVELQNYPLFLKLESATKWVSPPVMPSEGTVPDLVPLSPGELVTIESTAPYNTDSAELGDLLLSTSVPAGGETDIALYYSLNANPAGVLYALKFTLHSPAPNVDPSDPLYLVMSPAGANPVEKLHHASLYLEEYLATATAVPEPGAIGLVVLGVGMLAWRWRAISNR